MAATSRNHRVQARMHRLSQKMIDNGHQPSGWRQALPAIGWNTRYDEHYVNDCCCGQCAEVMRIEAAVITRDTIRWCDHVRPIRPKGPSVVGKLGEPTTKLASHAEVDAFVAKNKR